jgi:hypothetical protein
VKPVFAGLGGVDKEKACRINQQAFSGIGRGEIHHESLIQGGFQNLTTKPDYKMRSLQGILTAHL